MSNILRNRRLATALALLGMTAGVSAGAAGAQAPAQTSAAIANSYVLGPNDEIEMTVFGQPNMALKARIKADGTVIAPFLGEVHAADRTAGQLSRELAEAYRRGGYLSSPSINVEVTTYGSKTVTVGGLVTSAGLYALDRPYTIADIVARAGGVREGGAQSAIVTGADGTKREVAIQSPEALTRLQAGDTVYVPPAPKLYVYGAVKNGGAYDYRPGMTYRQILAVAGGPTLAGSTKRIEVRRDGQPVKANLDDQARPEDVLVVKEKLF